MIIEAIPENEDFSHLLPAMPETLGVAGEFGQLFDSPEHEVNSDTDGVVALSAYEFHGTPEDFDPEDPVNAENIGRIQVAELVAKEVAAKRVGKSVEDLDAEDLEIAPPLILNGTTEQLPFMEAIARSMSVPEGRVASVDCGAAGTANTRTQFQAMNEYAASLETPPRHLAFVTSAYHVPRTVRTGNANLVDVVGFNVVHVPAKKVDPKVVAGEVARITLYGTIKNPADITPTRDRPKRAA